MNKLLARDKEKKIVEIVAKKFPFKSLREWIEFLEERGDLLLIQEEVDLKEEIDAICRRNSDAGGVAGARVG